MCDQGRCVITAKSVIRVQAEFCCAESGRCTRLREDRSDGDELALLRGKVDGPPAAITYVQ